MYPSHKRFKMCTLLSQINYIALLISALASMIIGFLWYSDMLFLKTWMRLAKISEEQMKHGNMALDGLKGFIVTLLCSTLIAIIFHYANNSLAGAAGILSFVTVFFGLSVGERIVWEKMPVGLFVINITHKIFAWFISLAVYGWLYSIL